MNPIDYTNLTPDQRTVLMLQKQDDMSEKIEGLCVKQESQEHRLTIIETEHSAMKTNCGVSQSMTRKQTMIAAGSGGGLVGAILILAEVLMKYLAQGKAIP